MKCNTETSSGTVSSEVPSVDLSKYKSSNNNNLCDFNNTKNHGELPEMPKKEKHDNGRYFMGRLVKELGITPEQAIGIGANIIQECWRFNHKCCGKSGTGGILMWELGKNIQEDMVTWCSAKDGKTYKPNKKIEYGKIENNVQYIPIETQTSYAIACLKGEVKTGTNGVKDNHDKSHVIKYIKNKSEDWILNFDKEGIKNANIPNKDPERACYIWAAMMERGTFKTFQKLKDYIIEDNKSKKAKKTVVDFIKDHMQDKHINTARKIYNGEI